MSRDLVPATRANCIRPRATAIFSRHLAAFLLKALHCPRILRFLRPLSQIPIMPRSRIIETLTEQEGRSCIMEEVLGKLSNIVKVIQFVRFFTFKNTVLDR